MYRLYVDEVGTDGLTHVAEDNHRYFSLTGVAMEIAHCRDHLEPALNWIKAEVFKHDPDAPLIFHRTDIPKKKRQFGILNDPKKHALFDRAILRVFSSSVYKVITIFVDKKEFLEKEEWREKHPYHYLMKIMVEKYVQLLERNRALGDIMPEGRRGKKDAKLQEAFTETLKWGTYYVSSDRMRNRLTCEKLKFRYKHQNIAGLQLCDLLAHPSHMHVRTVLNHDVELGEFAKQVVNILVRSKYDRSSAYGKITGYGVKWFP